MNGERARTYLISGLLAVPPVVLAGYFCNSVTPQPEKVPVVVGANDPEVGLAKQLDARAYRPPVQLAERQH